MIHVSETIALHTVEDFLTEEDLSQLNKIVDNESWPEADAGTLTRYVQAPDAAQAILRQAVERALPSIRRVMPSIVDAAPWLYAELNPGDSVPVHVDGIPDPAVAPRRIGRIGVTISAPEAGGEFYLATTSSPELWTDTRLGEADGYTPGTRLTRRLPHEAVPDAVPHHSGPTWTDTLPKTRWTADDRPGVALVYGAQLMHGVTPVARGVLRKFVTDLLDTPVDAPARLTEG
ncbi:hypothetical protein [Streptomyces sp. NPDC002851]